MGAEGCEFDALLSARETVLKAQPEILIEVCPYMMARCGTSTKDEAKVWKLLDSLHYKVFLYFHDTAPALALPVVGKVLLPHGLLPGVSESLRAPLVLAPMDMPGFRQWMDAERR